MVRIVVVVSVCMMVVAVLVKSELVPKLSTEVDVIMVISVWIVPSHFFYIKSVKSCKTPNSL